MGFHFIDRIVQITRNKSITALRYLSSTEQYLSDHFPKFPIMPGVLILESAIQAASWLLRYSQEFEPTCISVTEVSNVKFGQFVKPGDTLELKADLVAKQGEESDFIAHASLNGKGALKVRFRLKIESLMGRSKSLEYVDAHIRDEFRKRFDLISKQAVLV